MKRTITAILLAALTLTLFAACGNGPGTTTTPKTHVTPNSVVLLVTYPDGTQRTHEFSSGKSTLGEVLRDYGLIECDATGMVVKVDGVEANGKAGQAYWAFYIGGEFASHGVDDEVLTGMNEYEFRYTKL